MSRYEFDQLGWYNFEWLVQTLLKAEFGFEVESWGAHKDQGRDAYSEGPLSSKRTETLWDGPVIIQAKFVGRANSLGSDYWPNLRSACKTEAALIAERQAKGLWSNPKTYVLVTNCPLTATNREGIEEIFANAPTSKVIALGAGDLSDALDLYPEVARNFPQILSYRNLVTAIQDAQNLDIKERTYAALAGAEEILPVFVPTEAYEKSWKVAREHSFVVLTGPPEMGKTSIGWMIAMAQLANGWEVIECRDPDDFFKTYKFERKQLFLADDAFGKTEFKPQKGDLWESDLAKILQRVDSTHWLVWTSRKHILERAIREMDLGGKARQYPKPAEVLVQADKLTQREKALILYRHAVNANLEVGAKQVLKGNLSSIVNDRHFTPERIRRFVREALPELAARAKLGKLTPQDVAIEVEAALKRYTDMMEKSYEKLSDEQKWVLVALLDEDNVRTEEHLHYAVQRLCPYTLEIPTERLLKELDESFLRTRHLGGFEWPNFPGLPRKLDWVHPSYRDLVIEKISLNRAMRLRYLEVGGMPALSLALSQTGGAVGSREFPLLPDSESWETLRKACVALIESGDDGLISQIIAIADSVSVQTNQLIEEFDELVKSICYATTNIWNKREKRVPAKMLESFFGLASKSKHEIDAPKVGFSWEESTKACQEGWTGDSHSEYANELLDWSKLAKTLVENEPRSAKKFGFPLDYEDFLDQIVEKCQDEADTDYSVSTSDRASAESERISLLARATKALSDAVPSRSDELLELSDELRMKAEALEETSDQLLEQERERQRDRDSSQDNDEEEDRTESRFEVFNLSDLFSDL